MALLDEVQSRYSTEILKQLTNPDDTSATSINTTILGVAAADTVAAFERLALATYDNDNAVHIEVCAQGVVAKLKVFSDPNNKEDWEKFETDCVGLAEGNIPAPSTNSTIVVEADPEEGTEFRNKKSHWTDYRPGN